MKIKFRCFYLNQFGQENYCKTLIKKLYSNLSNDKKGNNTSTTNV